MLHKSGPLLENDQKKDVFSDGFLKDTKEPVDLVTRKTRWLLAQILAAFGLRTLDILFLSQGYITLALYPSMGITNPLLGSISVNGCEYVWTHSLSAQTDLQKEYK